MLFPLYNDFRSDVVEGELPAELKWKYARIAECRDLRAVEVCSACLAFNECGLVKEYLGRVEEFRASGRNSGDAL